VNTRFFSFQPTCTTTAFLSTAGVPLGSLPFCRELPVRLRDCRRVLPLRATAGALYLPAGVSGANGGRGRDGGGAERSGAESPLPALYVSPCSFLPLLPALSLPAGREFSCRYAPLSGGSSLSAVSLQAGLGELSR